MSAVCDVKCGYQVNGFCTKPLLAINRFGQCVTWFEENSRLRPADEVTRLEDNFNNRREIKVEELDLEKK